MINNGNDALVPQNSYAIASTYLVERTFKHLPNNLKSARKSVNGGTNGLDEVNHAYEVWLNVFKQLTA